LLECVINVSEGRRLDVVASLARAAGSDLLDVHVDADHHRCVLTVVGEGAAWAVASAAVATLDLRGHVGVHPRLGVLDGVPFVPLGSATLGDAVAARDRLAHRLASELGVPCFLYGPERTLPEVRRLAFDGLEPDVGPPIPHPRAGATAVGARGVLVAYNVWLAPGEGPKAAELARRVRGPSVRALALATGATMQVSMNLLEPSVVGPADVYDLIAAGAAVERAELVGLVPEVVLATTPEHRWAQLDLAPDRTIEARLRGSAG
jgi:glutamate formiminotransferase